MVPPEVEISLEPCKPAAVSVTVPAVMPLMPPYEPMVSGPELENVSDPVPKLAVIALMEPVPVSE